MQIYKSSDGLQFAIAHCYSEHTGEYVTATAIFRDPIDGRFHVPPFTTLVAPDGEVSDSLTHKFDIASSSWTVVNDFRRARLYSTLTGYVVSNELKIGDPLPNDVTTLAPPLVRGEDHKAFRWSETNSQWRVIPDFSQATLWRKDTAQVAPPIPCGEGLPAELTTVHPPTGTFKAHEAVWWNEPAGHWQVVPDFSKVSTWFKADGSLNPDAVPFGAELSEDLTIVAPPPAAGVPVHWDNERGTWVSTGS